jgi:hypothetical protein
MSQVYGQTSSANLSADPEKPSDKLVDHVPGGGHGNLRVHSETVDVSILKEKIVFPFSGKVAPNRFLKAPMTERLCPWPENHAEDKVGLSIGI